VSLANPAMLAGLVLVVLPVIAHLTGAREVRRVAFPAVRFLGEAHQSLRRRWLLADLLLMAVRIAAVVAVVGLFCRPTWQRQVAVSHGVDPSVPTVLVVDRSMSTQLQAGGARVFDTIREHALEQLRTTRAPADVVLMDDRASSIGGGLGTDVEKLSQELTDLRPGHGSTDLIGAIRLAVDLATAGDGGQVLVLGDGTVSELTGVVSPPAGVGITYRDLSGEPAANHFPDTVEIAPRESGIGLDVTVGGPDRADAVPIDLHVEGIEPLRGTAVPGRVRPFTVVQPPPGFVPCTAELGGDALGADDALPFFLRGERRVDVHLVGGRGGAVQRGGDLYYLVQALDPVGDGRLAPRVIQPDELRELDAARGTVLILADVPCTPQLSAEVERIVRGGGGVVMAAGSLLRRQQCNEHLGGLLPADLGSVKSREVDAFEHGRVGLAAPDVRHPLWAPFQLGGRRTFASVRFERVLEVEPHLHPDSEVLLRYTDGRAALLQRRIGDGRLLLFTSTLDADWNDLPIRAIYVPMVHQLVRYLAGETELRGGETHVVGDRPELSQARASTVLLRHADGVEVPLDGGGRLVLPRLDLPGHYQLLDEGGELLQRFCVRIDPAESRRTAIDPGALNEAVPGIVFVRQGRAGEPGRATVLRPVSLIPHALTLLLLALGGEAVLGRRR